MAKKKHKRIPYPENKENARKVIQRLVWYMDAADVDDDERAEITARIEKMALSYGLQKELRKQHII